MTNIKVMADTRSAESMRLVEYRALALAALSRFGVPWRHGRRIWKLQVVKMANEMPERSRKMNSSFRGFFIIFSFLCGLVFKRWGVLCSYLIYLPFRKKKRMCLLDSEYHCLPSWFVLPYSKIVFDESIRCFLLNWWKIFLD